MERQEQTSSTPVCSVLPWHQQPGLLARFMTDLVAEEIGHLRPGAAPLPAGPWPLQMPLGEDGLGLDSLERMSVAAALNEALHLHESDADDLLSAHTTFGDWLQVAARALAHFDARVTFNTSGCCGRPKPFTHTLADLQQQARRLARVFTGAQREPLRRALAAVPAHHVDGFLFTVLLPGELAHLSVEGVRGVSPSQRPRRAAASDLPASHPAPGALLTPHASARLDSP